MDEDFDYTFWPSGDIYGARAVKLDTANQKQCYLGSANSPCVGITPQQSAQAPGTYGQTTGPILLASATSTSSAYNFSVPVYGINRKCLWDVDPNFGGQIKPGDFGISSDSGFMKKASPFGPWNQWVVAISLSFANSGQSCNVVVDPFPWMPTGS